MAVALLGMLLLLFASVKVFVWMNERVVRRQMAYEATRVNAGAGTPNQVSDIWTDPSRQNRLDFFSND